MSPSTPVTSMTGFARADGTVEGMNWLCELKSVNGRSLEIRTRFPSGFESLEVPVRAELGRRLRRGSVSLTVTLNRAAATLPQARINRPLLDQLLALVREVEGVTTPPRLEALLTAPGVISVIDDAEAPDRARVEEALLSGVRVALDRLVVVRDAEGARLLEVVRARVCEIENLTDDASRLAAVQPEALRERLRAQMAILLESQTGVSEDRLAQEVAFLVSRGDVREELDRLRAHGAAARDILAEGGVIGRRLDFLCQEYNRESNTLCAKSSDPELSRIGLALKVCIEQLREQVQNIE
ncbi:YicC family protein [Azospirillaceae bacterium]